ncbi:hypothetical protein CYMTET_25055 [Cymbomonas tetramitiformis]|uniref:Uncharacterized protein n=1 Tax=Cymbomonas tetramitiformis TaxID=36881 RepID=A0AAE0FUL1_9CHLO|nr:hypothetical protein CYMTET_25055 [Cymbomonas tetramitiformis]
MAGSAEETAPATGAAEANTPAAGVNSAGALAGLEALVLQQSAMMNQMTPKVNELSDRVAASEEASAKAVAQASGSAQSGDAELEAPRKLPYVPHVAGNPFPQWPSTLESDMPQMYDLYNDKTHDALSKRTN